MKKWILVGLILPFFALAQTPESSQGMKFEHGLSWTQVLAKAKAENKYIFMDCYTTWCGPCKFMTANIFPLPQVGAFFNDNYINVKVQLDTTANDNDEVKSWFKDGQEIATKYQVRAYPTYLFFDPNGQIVHRAVGSSDAEKFLAKGKDAVTPEKQYYTTLRKVENGQKDPATLRTLSLMALDAYDMPTANKISEAYIQTQSDLFTKENLDFVFKFTSNAKSQGFAMLMNNTEKVNAVLGKGMAEDKLMGIIVQEEVYPVILKRNATAEPDFASLNSNIEKKYPKFAAEATAKSKVIYYQYKGNWDKFQTEIVAFMKQYGDHANPNELNSYAWAVFENCKDMTCVTEALNWSKRSFKDKESPMFMDTYANILHKLGKTKEAIEWQTKAVTLAGETEKKTYQETLEKMKKGEKTWAEKE